MLVYRDFAIQDDRRTYLPGPALAATQVVGRRLQQLRKCLHPHLDELCERVHETVNLIVRVGVQARFLASVESTQILHVGDRQGTILPAHLTSGGKALLAELDTGQLERLYRPGPSRESAASDDDTQLSEREWAALLRELASVRSCGYSLNREETETGVSAVGMCLYDAQGQPVAAISISAPSARFGSQRAPSLVLELRVTVDQAQSDLRSLPDT